MMYVDATNGHQFKMATVALQPKFVLSIYRSMKLVRDLILVAIPMLYLLYMIL